MPIPITTYNNTIVAVLRCGLQDAEEDTKMTTFLESRHINDNACIYLLGWPLAVL